MSSYRKCYLIPPDENQCQWMSAGIVSYQLCSRMFDCDGCPIDQAMHRRFSGPLEAPSEERLISLRPAVHEIPHEGFQYSPNHWWIRRTSPDLFRLGIEIGVARVLEGAKGIVFTASQQRVHAGQTCVWVVMDGGTVPLEAPLDGLVRSVNYNLVAKPHLLSMHPFSEGWLYDLEPDSPDSLAAGFMSADEAELRFRNDQTRFLTALTSAIRGKRSQVGSTLAAGGEKLQGLVAMLGTTRYFALVRQHFGGSKH